MLNRLSISFVLFGLLAGAEPPWRTPGACLTPTGTLCRTLVYERSGWSNRSWGVHAVERYRDRLTEAVRGDGSAMLRVSHRSFRFYVVPYESYDRVRIVLPGTQRTFEIEHSLKEFRALGGVWRFSERWTDDPDCAMRAAWAGEVGRRSGNQSVVAGVRAIEYTYAARHDRMFQRIAFAPSLGCTAVAWSFSERNAAGLPTAEQTLRLVFADLGEPAERLFAIPDWYQVMRPEKPWPYIWMDAFPGNFTLTAFSAPVE